MAAIVPRTGPTRQLDRAAPQTDRITPDDVGDSKLLARLLNDIRADVAGLLRRWAPQRVDFEDVAVDSSGTTKYRLAHGLNGRVRWWAIDWSGSAGPALSKDSDTDSNTLVLVSHTAGTVTIRVEAAG